MDRSKTLGSLCGLGFSGACRAEFRTVRDQWQGSERTIHEAQLVGLAVVDQPAYLGAGIEAREAVEWLKAGQPSGKIGGESPMAVDIATLAVELRLATDPASPPPEPLSGTLSRTLRAAQAIVNPSASADDAPEAIRDLAVIAVASYVFDRPTAPQGERFANPWRNSGAEANAKSRWIDPVGPWRSADPMKAADDAPAPIPGPSKSAKGPPLIDAVLTSANPISSEARGDGRRATLQVIASDRFEAVDIEASFLEDGQPVEMDSELLPYHE